jgi:hypothetical protein
MILGLQQIINQRTGVLVNPLARYMILGLQQIINQRTGVLVNGSVTLYDVSFKVLDLRD